MPRTGCPSAAGHPAACSGFATGCADRPHHRPQPRGQDARYECPQQLHSSPGTTLAYATQMVHGQGMPGYNAAGPDRGTIGVGGRTVNNACSVTGQMTGIWVSKRGLRSSSWGIQRLHLSKVTNISNIKSVRRYGRLPSRG